METLQVHFGFDQSMDQKWLKMVILSLILHLAVFSTVLFVPEPTSTRRLRNIVYEVNLVEMPRAKRSNIGTNAKAKEGKTRTAPVKVAPTKRIDSTKKKEKPMVLAKRTVKVKAKKITRPEVSSAKLLDQALERIERKVEKEEKEPVVQKISKIEGNIKESSGTGPVGRNSATGIIMDIYTAEIKDRVCSNWSYPVALLGPYSERDLKTVVVLKVEKNGTILRTSMTRSSGNSGYDQSVLKAIKRSDPLPPFPEGYRKTYEEIEINFNLSDLKNQ